MNILIVDDDTNNLNRLKKIIEDNYNEFIYCSNNYKDALEILETNVIDIFLLDIDLGGSDSGMDLAKKIRKIPIYRSSHIIFITALEEEILSGINDIHCYAYVTKPFDNDYIIEILNDIIKPADIEITKLKIKKATFITSVPQNDIIYIESHSKHLLIYTITSEILYKNYSLIKILDELNPRFVQCHKKYIVNTDFIEKYDYVNGKVSFMFTKNIVSVGRTYKANFKAALKACFKNQ